MNLNINETQAKKLTSLENRAKFLCRSENIPTLQNMMAKRACMLVRLCLNGNICINFKNYFTIVNHSRNTRSNMVNVMLPKVKLQTGKFGFYYMGAKRYNELPVHIKESKNISEFRKNLNEYFN